MSTVITDKKTSNTKLNELEQIKKFTTVVADTADFESVREFKPQDATTNPICVYAATQKANYSHFLEEVLVDRGTQVSEAQHRWRTSSITFHCGSAPRSWKSCRSGLDGDRSPASLRRPRFDQESATYRQAL